MTKCKEKSSKNCNCKMSFPCSNGGGAFYGLGLFGAAVYYFQQVASLQDGLLALLKTILWPAFLIYQVLQMINV